MVISREDIKRPQTPFLKGNTNLYSIGVDPGSRYTGVVVRLGDTVVWAETLVRTDELDQVQDYFLYVIDKVNKVVKHYQNIPNSEIIVSIEGVVDPKGFKGGKKAAINPKDIIRTAATFGALVAELKNLNPYIIRPGKHGSLDESWYPPEIKGRRAKSLLPEYPDKTPTRSHEKSAYDIAGAGILEHTTTQRWK